jgi:hypothetical protein
MFEPPRLDLKKGSMGKAQTDRAVDARWARGHNGKRARARALPKIPRRKTAKTYKIKRHQRLLQPICDLAQIIPLHWAGQMVVRVVDPEVRAEGVEGRGDGVVEAG